MSVEELQAAVAQLPAEELGRFSRWFEEFQAEIHTGRPEDAGAAIRSGDDLARSGIIGSWADRDDLADGQEFARRLRRQAETRGDGADAAGQ